MKLEGNCLDIILTIHEYLGKAICSSYIPDVDLAMPHNLLH